MSILENEEIIDIIQTRRMSLNEDDKYEEINGNEIWRSANVLVRSAADNLALLYV